MRFQQLLRFTSFALFGALISSCSLNPGGSSTVSFRIPSVAELNAKAGAQSSLAQSKGELTGLSIPTSELIWANACFMVSVTGDGIENRPTNLCQVPVGVFSGSVAPGGVLNLDVKKGTNRNFTVLAYFRSSAALPCETKASANDFYLDRTAQVGLVRNVTLSKDAEVVEVGITLPAAGETVASQYAFPPICAAQNLGSGLLRGVAGGAIGQVSTGPGYKMNSHISAPTFDISTSTNGYKLLRRGQQ